jgi:hypothetical protein
MTTRSRISSLRTQIVRRFSSDASSAATSLRIVDPHHHFFSPHHPKLHLTLKNLGLNKDYLLPDYEKDFSIIDPRSSSSGGGGGGGLKLIVDSSVHVEALPEDSVEEINFVRCVIKKSKTKCKTSDNNDNNHDKINRQICNVKGIVASCDITSKNTREQLIMLKKTSPALVKGVRWICNYDGDLKHGEIPVESKVMSMAFTIILII